MQMKRFLVCTPETSTGGYWDNSTRPVLTVDSGDIVEIETGTHYGGKMLPGVSSDVLKRWAGDLEAKGPENLFYPDEETGTAGQIVKKKGPGPHNLTGPIYVNDAEPGDALQIEILDIVPTPYGFNSNIAGSGLLPDDFPTAKVRWYKIDRDKFVFMQGIEIPVRPFPGTIGVELADKGIFNNIPPGRNGGNMDNKDLVAGSVLYLPIFVKGAGLKSGDSHAAQGHGEVDINGLECGFTKMVLKLTVRKDLKGLVHWPMASTPTHWIVMGFHTDLLDSARMATRRAVRFLVDYLGLPEYEAYAFCSLAVDLVVTQVVNYTKGIHALIPKACFTGEQFSKKRALLLQT